MRTRGETITGAEETRARILEAAVALFLEHGYDATTMRMVAEQARLGLGSSYYHFPSKEHVLQAVYVRIHAAHLAACGPVLQQERQFPARLAGVLHAKLTLIAPYHLVARPLLNAAAGPQVSGPESTAMGQVRQELTALFAAVVDDSPLTMPADLRPELPGLLWLYHQGVLHFWMQDASPGRRRTRRLVDVTVPLIGTLLQLSNGAVLTPFRRSLLALIGDLRNERAG